MRRCRLHNIICTSTSQNERQHIYYIDEVLCNAMYYYEVQWPTTEIGVLWEKGGRIRLSADFRWCEKVKDSNSCRRDE